MLHERVVGWTSPSGWMVVLSSDGDEWEEDVSGANPDCGPVCGRLLPHEGEGGKRMSLHRLADRLNEEKLQA